MKKKYVIVFLLWLTSVFFVFSENKSRLNIISIKYVSSKEGLNVREKPDLNSKKIAGLIYGSEVKIINIGPEATIDGITDNWVTILVPRMTWGKTNAEGWVFRGYLKENTELPILVKYGEQYEINKTNGEKILNIKRINNLLYLTVFENDKELFNKQITSYCFNKSKSKLFFNAEENYIKGKKIWEMENRHYSFYVMDLETFSINELFQNETVEGGFKLKISEDDNYLCYPEAGGEMSDRYSPRYYTSYGIGGIYDLNKGKTVLTQNHTDFYPLGNGYFLGKQSQFYYSLFDGNFKPVQKINLYMLADIHVSQADYIPGERIVYHNSYPYFFAFSSKDYTYRVIIKDNNVRAEKITDCEYAGFVTVNNECFCLLAKNQKLYLYNKKFELVGNMEYPCMPDNMEILNIDYNNGKFVINISLIEK